MASGVVTIDQLLGENREIREFLGAFLWGVGDGAPDDGVAAKRGALYLDKQAETLYQNVAVVNHSAIWVQAAPGEVADLGGTPPLVFRATLASGADGSSTITLPRKCRVIDLWGFLAGAGTAGSDVTLTDGTNTIVTLIDVSAGGDKSRFAAAEIDDAYHEVAAAGTLVVVYSSTGGDFPGAEVYVMCVPVA